MAITICFVLKTLRGTYGYTIRARWPAGQTLYANSESHLGASPVALLLAYNLKRFCFSGLQ